MAHFRKILAIINPCAGWRFPGNPRNNLEAILRGRGESFLIRETTGGGDAYRWAAGADDEGFDLVLAAGGDGTIREAVDGLMRGGANIPLAPIPTGTANLLALGLGIPIYLKRAVDSVLEGKRAPFDICRLVERDRHFLLAASAGYSAQMIKYTTRDAKTRLGFVAYITSGLRALFKLRNNRVTMVLDGERFTCTASSVFLINAPLVEQLDQILALGIGSHDGKIDIIVPRIPTIIERLQSGVRRITFRRKDFSVLEHRRAGNITIDADPSMPFQIDGELAGRTPVTIEVLPGGITLMVPQHYRGA